VAEDRGDAGRAGHQVNGEAAHRVRGARPDITAGRIALSISFGGFFDFLSFLAVFNATFRT
jgi:hypothetical protein